MFASKAWVIDRIEEHGAKVPKGLSDKIRDHEKTIDELRCDLVDVFWKALREYFVLCDGCGCLVSKSYAKKRRSQCGEDKPRGLDSEPALGLEIEEFVRHYRVNYYCQWCYPGKEKEA